MLKHSVRQRLLGGNQGYGGGGVWASVDISWLPYGVCNHGLAIRHLGPSGVQYGTTSRDLLEVLIRVAFPQLGPGRCGLDLLMPDPGGLCEIQVG